MVRGPLSGIAASGKSSDEGSDTWGYKIRVKGTFIDISNDEDGSLSPRPASDPGSLAWAASSHRDEVLEYANELSSALSQIWGQSTAAKSQSSLRDEDESVACSSDHDDPNLLLALDYSGAGASVADVMPALPPRTVGQGEGLSGKELRRHIKYATREVEKHLNQHRTLTALSVIQEIPEQVGGALQKTAMGIVDDVTEEVAVVKDIIEGGGTDHEGPGIDSAVAMLDVIPDMIQGSLEAYFSRAERNVRAHVDGMIQNLEAEPTSERVVEKMWAIPTEIQEIAKQTMQAAVAESRVQVKQQIHCALASLPNLGAQQLAGVAVSRIMPQVPTDSSGMAEGAKIAVVGVVEQAVAVVERKDHERMGVANQVVAETLLRAKAVTISAAEGLEKPPSLTASTNEGSIGHPELCQRPCLYFLKGACANGSSCSYCHLSHSRRPAHPDKKNRLILKEMSFAEHIAVFTPVLKAKMGELGLGDDVLQRFEDLLEVLTAGEAPEAPPQEAVHGRHKKQLQQFLHAMTLRSILALLMRPAPTVAQLAAIEGFMAKLRTASICRP